MNETGSMTVGILGGGLVGVALGGHLKAPNEILEADDQPGGHCRSLIKDGYTFDIGGPHILFSRNTEILDYMVSKLDGNVVEQYRNVKILYKDAYVKYPFENGLFDLSPEERFECLRDFMFNEHKGGKTFKDWIYRTFGKSIAEKYMLPYNEKIWNTTADQMNDDWVEGRVPKPSIEDIMKTCVGVETEGSVHQLYFKYPRVGGIESVITSFAKDCPKIITNFRVHKVWREDGVWCVSDGRDTRRYGTLVSTIPVQDLIAALPDVPADIIARVNALRYNSLSTIMLGVEAATPNPFTAIYLPEREVPFHRVSFPVNFSPEAAPKGHESFMVEITTNPGDGMHELDDQALIETAVDGLVKLKLMTRESLRFTAVHRARYAYVIRTFDYEENLNAVLDYLNGLGIISCGRNAEFAYINMDEAVRRALEVAKKLNGGD